VNVDLMFGLPGEDEGGQRASLAPAADLDDLGAGSARTRSCHCPALAKTGRALGAPGREGTRLPAAPRAGAPRPRYSSASSAVLSTGPYTSLIANSDDDFAH